MCGSDVIAWMSDLTDSAALEPTEQAIEWLVRLRSGEATPGDHRLFDHWIQCDDRHRAAWNRLVRPIDSAFAAVRQVNEYRPGHNAVIAEALSISGTRARSRRSLLRGAFVVGGVAVGTAAVGQLFAAIEDSLADFRTGTGERRRVDLPDGSTLTLNARSALDWASSSEGRRSASLRSGEVLVDVSADRDAPFMLQFRDGLVWVPPQSRRARFLVKQYPQRSLVVALDQGVHIGTRTNGVEQALVADEGVWIEGASIAPAVDRVAGVSSWTHGHFTADDRPLGEVIDAISAYRPGFVRISSEAAVMRVYGSYPLDDTDRTLAIIAETLPVSVHVHSGGWLVRIELS